MTFYSFNDIILSLNKENEKLQSCWQGDIANLYFEQVMGYYINYARSVEIYLQEINENMDYVKNCLSDCEEQQDPVYTYSKK